MPLSEQNIAQCIEHIWRLLRIDEKYPQVTLITKIDKHDTLYLPETLLEQILSNLITNSLQAGTKVLQISTHKAPDRLLIVIKDDAGGMSHSQLEQPFSFSNHQNRRSWFRFGDLPTLIKFTRC